MNKPLAHRVQNISTSGPQPGFSSTCLDRQEIFALGEDWEKLSRNAVEENPYYSPIFMRAALENLEANSNLKALAVYKGETLVGFCPFIIDKWRWLGACSLNRAWINPYSTLTIPLVDHRYPREVVTALLSAMGEHGAYRNFWLFDNFNLEGPVGTFFSNGFQTESLASEKFNEFDRPVLNQGSTFGQHMLDHVSKKRRKNLKRSRDKLSERGKVELRSFTTGPELKAAVEDFLAMEASGWKGQQGTALACNKNSLTFARKAFGGTGGKSITRADVLYLDEFPIAVSLSIYTGRTAFTLKCAYDETYRSYSPGLLLELAIIEDFFETRWVERLDSAVTTTGHVIQSLWNNSIRVGDLLLCADSSRSFDSFQNFAHMEKLRRLSRRKLKNIVAKYRGDAI